MNNWYLDVVSQGRVAVVNQPGRMVYGVHISNFGRAVVLGRRDWSRTVPAVEDGEGVAFTYARALGAHQDPPGIHVSYRLTDDTDGTVYSERLDLP